MSGRNRCLMALVAFVCIIGSVRALKCYVCLSPDLPCATAPSPSDADVVQCPEYIKTCSSLSGMMFNGKNTTLRACYEKDSQLGCFPENIGSDQLTRCNCNKDLCNAASSLSMAAAALLLVPSLIAALVY